MIIDTNQYASLEELLTAYESATETEREAMRRQGEPEPEFDFFKLFDFEQEDLYKRVMQKMDSLTGLGKRQRNQSQSSKRETATSTSPKVSTFTPQRHSVDELF